MNKYKLTDFFLYKKRFLIGYGLILISLVAILVFTGFFLPGGLSNKEIQSVVTSDSTRFQNLLINNPINLPYHFLQHLVFTIFGVTTFTIKLPSLILAFFSVIGLGLILRIWFKPSVGLLSTLIAITTGQFLFIAQDGTPNILYLFWPVCLLLLATLASYQRDFKWPYIIGFFIAASLSLYTPLSVYLLIAFVLVTVLHPHLRCVLRSVPKKLLLIGIFVSILIATPLMIGIIKSPSISLAMFGIPSSSLNLSANLSSLGAEFFGFSRPGGLTSMTPFFELGSMLIIAIGAFYVIKTRVTAKNYIISAWIICLIPLMILNPEATSITFLPLVLLLATGLNTILMYWYRLFPNNPYARIVGLIPLTTLTIVLIFSGSSRFINGYRYDPSIVSNFSNDLKLLPKNTNNLLVSNDELAFYSVVNKYNKKYFLTTEIPQSDSFVATKKANKDFESYQLDRIVTSSRRDDNVRFYLYTKIKN